MYFLWYAKLFISAGAAHSMGFGELYRNWVVEPGLIREYWADILTKVKLIFYSQISNFVQKTSLNDPGTR